MLPIIPEPYRLVSRIATVALVALALYLLGRSHGADHVQSRWDAEKLQQTQQAVAAEQAARQREQAMINQVRKAENDAQDRETKRRAAVAAADDAAGRLRLALDTIRHGLPADPAAACRTTADAALAVFGDCTARLGALAQAADGHASDAETMTAAWPR